jgi:hypothetical protein
MSKISLGDVALGLLMFAMVVLLIWFMAGGQVVDVPPDQLP